MLIHLTQDYCFQCSQRYYPYSLWQIYCGRECGRLSRVRYWRAICRLRSVGRRMGRQWRHRPMPPVGLLRGEWTSTAPPLWLNTSRPFIAGITHASHQMSPAPSGSLCRWLLTVMGIDNLIQNLFQLRPHI